MICTTFERKQRRPWPPLTVALLAVFVVTNGGTSNDAQASEITWEGGITLVYQDTDDSRANSELTASADIFATLEKGRGKWLLYIEGSSAPGNNGVSAYYPAVNGDAGSVLTAGGDAGLQISEFNYTFFLRGQRSLMMGLVDPSAWLDRGRIANDENTHFLNGSFVNNAMIAFPDYTLGGVFRALGNDRRPEITIVVSGSDGIADTPDRSYQDLLDLNEDGRGVFVGSGASWLTERTSWRVGAWLRNDDQDAESGSSSAGTNYGAYGVFGWQSGVNALNIRIGMANSRGSIANRFLATVYQRQTRSGVLGVGVAGTKLTDRPDLSFTDDALDAEVYFRIPVFDNSGHITPSIQYVRAPDVDGGSEASSAVVAGMRLRWSF